MDKWFRPHFLSGHGDLLIQPRGYVLGLVPLVDDEQGSDLPGPGLVGLDHDFGADGRRQHARHVKHEDRRLALNLGNNDLSGGVHVQLWPVLLLDLEVMALELLVLLEVLEFAGREVHNGLDAEQPQLLVVLIQHVHHVAHEEHACLDLARVAGRRPH